MPEPTVATLPTVTPQAGDLFYAGRPTDLTDGPAGSDKAVLAEALAAYVVALVPAADAAGTAAGLMVAHVLAADPHTQYALESALGTAAALNVPASGDATSGQVVKGSDTRLSDARTPTTHTHTASQISDSTAVGRAVVTSTDAAAARTAIGAGTGSGTVTSVDVSGGTTGLTASGGPVTSSGTITLAGTLAVANGGTGRATSTTAYGLLAAGTTATGAHQTLAAGATTEVLVGGGAAALPAWTTATGTGAPVRAGSPTIATPVFTGIVNMTNNGQINGANSGYLQIGSAGAYLQTNLNFVAGGFVQPGTYVALSNDTARVSAPATKVVSLDSGATLRSVPLTPTQITADQNNYAPGVAMFYRISTDASRTIHGLSVGQVDGQLACFLNVGSNNAVLPNQSASATAANRFITGTGADITLTPDTSSGWFMYDATSSRWRKI